MMQQSKSIRSLQDLKQEERMLRQSLLAKEERLKEKFNRIPGELFYSSVDNILPNIIRGKVSSFALNAGRGVINGFFLKQTSIPSGPLKILQAVKPSGLFKKAGAGITALFNRKKK